MASSPAPPAPRLANLPWLDFVNTRFLHGGRWTDALATPRLLAAWWVEGGLEPRPGGLAVAVRRRGPSGRRLFRQAHHLRAHLAELARALAGGAPPPAAAITAINRVLRAAPTRRELRAGPAGSVVEGVVFAGRDPLGTLAPIAESAAGFLLAGDRSRLRVCGNPECVLYFYDRTRNGRRRFCSAASCGNRVKAARRYQRLRAARSG
jgi:predicted RNA-binding Zn ribbon-like protein